MSTEYDAAIERYHKAEADLEEALMEMGRALANVFNARGQSELVRQRLAYNVWRFQHTQFDRSKRIKEGLSKRPEAAIVIEYGEMFPGQGYLPEPDRQYLEMIQKALGPRFRVWAHRTGPSVPEWAISALLLGWPKEHQSAVPQHGRRRAGRRSRQ